VDFIDLLESLGVVRGNAAVPYHTYIEPVHSFSSAWCPAAK
jgi:hypothetical protein